MPVFSPPTHDINPPVLPSTRGVPRRLFRHYGPRAVGRSVLKTGGVYRTVDTPTQAQLDAASEFYLGGHVYQVSEAVAAALEAAGYGGVAGGGVTRVFPAVDLYPSPTLFPVP